MKVWTQVPHGDINAANQRLWRAFRNNADEVADRLNTDPEFVGKVARFMISGGYEPSESQILARVIMGRNFFGIEEAIKYFGVKATKQQLSDLGEIPFKKSVLESCKDTHILVAVFPLSILDIHGVDKNLPDQTLLYSMNWYKKLPFAADKGIPTWQLVRKEPIPNSVWETLEGQLALLSKNEELPTAQIMVYTIIGHFLATDERLFEGIYVRCINVDSFGARVAVGDFDHRGLAITSYSDDYRGKSVGLSAAFRQKPEFLSF
jgi:hypothetical protein